MKCLMALLTFFLLIVSSVFAEHNYKDLQATFQNPPEWKVKVWADAEVSFSGSGEESEVVSLRNRGDKKHQGPSENAPEQALAEPSSGKSIGFDDEQPRKIVSSAKLGDSETLMTSELAGDRVIKLLPGPDAGGGKPVYDPMFKDDATGVTRPLVENDLKNISTGKSSGIIIPPGQRVNQSGSGPGG